MPQITIIIPCFNCSDTIMRTWNSITSQTIGLDNLECIFVDDASTDNGVTWDLLQKIEAEAPESVAVIHLDENMRQGGARNVALGYASGKYVQFLDSDDMLREDACETLYRYAEETQAEIVMFNHLYKLNDAERISGAARENKVYEIADDEDRKKYLNSTFVDYGCTNKLYRLDLIRKAKAMFAEHVVYEEPLFVYPCFLYLNRFAFLNEALYIYVFRPKSTVTSLLGTHILDHPNVQLQLLEHCLQRPDLYNRFRDVIGAYFLWSFYCETLSFASENAGSVIPLSYFKQMQAICLKIFPDWKDNPELKHVGKNVQELLETIESDIDTQEELDRLIARAGEIL